MSTETNETAEVNNTDRGIVAWLVVSVPTFTVLWGLASIGNINLLYVGFLLLPLLGSIVVAAALFAKVKLWRYQRGTTSTESKTKNKPRSEPTEPNLIQGAIYAAVTFAIFALVAWIGTLTGVDHLNWSVMRTTGDGVIALMIKLVVILVGALVASGWMFSVWKSVTIKTPLVWHLLVMVLLPLITGIFMLGYSGQSYCLSEGTSAIARGSETCVGE